MKLGERDFTPRWDSGQIINTVSKSLRRLETRLVASFVRMKTAHRSVSYNRSTEKPRKQKDRYAKNKALLKIKKFSTVETTIYSFTAMCMWYGIVHGNQPTPLLVTLRSANQNSDRWDSMFPWLLTVETDVCCMSIKLCHYLACMFRTVQILIT